jgi:YHS domain-containing protein
MIPIRQLCLAASFAAFALFAPALSLAAEPEIFTGFVPGVAIGGYDAVAYFEAGKPMAGSAALTTEWKGAVWRFASQENLDKFRRSPESYAPQYGGYCAFAVANGATAKGEPEIWRIVDNKLYLNYSADVQKTWQQDIPGNIAKADGNWPGVLE